jgi:hypothetical protein
MRPIKWARSALDVGLYHVQIANRGNQPVHLEFTPRSLMLTSEGESPKLLATCPG